MSTPIKLRALSPKILSSLSPTKIFDYNLKACSPKLLQSDAARKPPTVSKLHIPQSSTGTKFNTSSPIITFDLVEDKERNRFFDGLNINSPEKLHIQEAGLDARKDLNVLGRGRFGTVVKGFYKGDVVAVKVIKLSSQTDDYPSESNAMNLSSENVVRTLDVIVNKSLNYAIILMEYLENCQNLHDVLNARKLNRSEYTRFATDISRGLSYCHSRNVFHMDLKPMNILISARQVCKLCDFGNSYADGSARPYVHQGTVAYTAPEILTGQLPTAKCDVYSLGVTLWQIKYANVPYEEFTAKEMLIYKVVKFGIRPERDGQPADDDAYNAIYRNCWHGDPRERANVTDVLLALSAL